jgi:hypothetical protein
MTNSAKTYLFLRNASAQTRDTVLNAIANHYGISKNEAFDEVTSEGAEYLVDYLTGNLRFTVHTMMRQAGLA